MIKPGHLMLPSFLADDGFKLPGLETPLAAGQPATPAESAATPVDGNAPPLVQTAPATPSSAPTDPFAPADTTPSASNVSVPKAKEKDDFYSSDSDEEASETASKPRRQFKVRLGAKFHSPGGPCTHCKRRESRLSFCKGSLDH